MKMIIGTLAVVLALVSGVGAVSAMPNTGVNSDFERVFEPKN